MKKFLMILSIGLIAACGQKQATNSDLANLKSQGGIVFIAPVTINGTDYKIGEPASWSKVANIVNQVDNATEMNLQGRQIAVDFNDRSIAYTIDDLYFESENRLGGATNAAADTSGSSPYDGNPDGYYSY